VSQGIVSQQTQEVDNAETAAAVAIDDRESAVKKLANAQRALEDAKGKQQHSLQVTASPSALPEVMPVIAESQISACRCLGALCMPQYCLHMFSLPPDNPSIKTLSFARTYTDNQDTNELCQISRLLMHNILHVLLLPSWWFFLVS